MNWHYKNSDQVVGALSEEAMKELHACGMLAGDTQVRKDASEEWLPFDKAFEKGGAPPELLIKFHCSNCETKIAAGLADAGTSANCPSCGNELVVPLEAADGIEPSNSLEQLPVITANTSESQCATDDSASHQPETDELTSNSAVDLSKTASGEGSPMHKFGTTLASFAKSAAHDVKLSSQIAVLKTRIENAKQIELRKAYYALGRKLYEERILFSMQNEIEGLERQLAEKGERPVIAESETKGAMLKRVGTNAAKSAESELLSLKLKQSLTHLGELARNSSQQTSLPGAEAEMKAILLVESKIQQFEEESRSLRALSGVAARKVGKKTTRALILLFLLSVVVIIKMMTGGKDVTLSVNEMADVTGENYASEQFQIAMRYFEGEKLPGEATLKADIEVKNPELAFRHFLNAADKGLPEAKFYVAICYLSGTGVTKSADEAISWLKQAAEDGFAKAQYTLGVAYTTGEGVSKNDKFGLEWIARAAEQGDSDATCYLGSRYLLGEGVKKDEKRSVGLFRKGADKKHGKSNYYLGLCYEDGTGVENDPKMAAHFLASANLLTRSLPKDKRLAAGHPLLEYDPARQVDCGLAYMNGENVVKSNINAAWLFREAADRGDPRGQFMTSRCYAEGIGVREDKKSAVDWCRKSADLGYAPAQSMMGLYYSIGLGVDQDEKLSADWYQKAAIQNHAGALLALGHDYSEGEGVVKNAKRAYMCFLLANRLGVHMANADRTNIDRVKSEVLSKNETGEAVAMAALWEKDPSARKSLLK